MHQAGSRSGTKADLLKWNQRDRRRRSAPSPRAPGLPGSRLILRKSGRPDLRWGRAGEGGRSYGANCIRQLLPPPPSPPHKGEGSTPCVLQLSCIQLSGTSFIPRREEPDVSIIWTIIIGFVAGIIAKFLHPGPNEPSGFILTTILGIVGALVATYLGQAIGRYQAGEVAGLIGAIVGAVIVLVIWGLVTGRSRATV